MTTLLLLAAAGVAAARPLQVVIMAGQSNMVGHGYAAGSNCEPNCDRVSTANMITTHYNPFGLGSLRPCTPPRDDRCNGAQQPGEHQLLGVALGVQTHSSHNWGLGQTPCLSLSRLASARPVHWNASAPGNCGGTAGGCVVPQPALPPNLNGSLLTPGNARDGIDIDSGRRCQSYGHLIGAIFMYTRPHC